jgi:hypothetical protein
MLGQCIDNVADHMAVALERADNRKQQRRPTRPETRTVMEIFAVLRVAQALQFGAVGCDVDGEIGRM